ncbi:DUF4236 domain-containing protein [Stenotrophomonas rhizophila]|uniref:DUF4236 domain-containing protein n=1 Tax=Stenotrophomonas rhizophila TaxID=216778 RepID=UPI003D0CD5EF
MALYLRKSVRVGPLRFNLSKGGVGVSAGIKGFGSELALGATTSISGPASVYCRATIPFRSDEIESTFTTA